MKKLIALLLVVVMVGALFGCASWSNGVAQRGSVIGTTKANYVVVNYAGTKIMDVWVLKDAYVESESESDGWRFIDGNSNPVKIGGDAKIIRATDGATFAKYKEYHYEFDGGDYYDFLKK